MRPLPATAVNEPVSLQRRDWIAGLERGLSLIEAFDDQHPRMTAAQVGQRCGLTRTAARRHLLTLAHLGYVAGDGKLFWLTPRVMRLGQAYLDSARLPRLAQPFLQRISAGTHETAYLSVLDDDDIVYVARSGSLRQMNTGFVLGARVPAHVTASGMLLLALQGVEACDAWLDGVQLSTFTQHTISDKGRLRLELARIRAQEWAISEQQLDLSIRGVAVPLRDHRGKVQGALSVNMPVQQESADEARHRVLPVLREAAQAMRNLM